MKRRVYEDDKIVVRTYFTSKGRCMDITPTHNGIITLMSREELEHLVEVLKGMLEE